MKKKDVDEALGNVEPHSSENFHSNDVKSNRSEDTDLVNIKNEIGVEIEAIMQREKLIAAREDAVYLRECEIDKREMASQFQGGLHDKATKQHIVSDDQISMLQKANAELVISSIKAHKIVEQVESAKVELDYLAHHDVLTGLPNRMLLQDRIHQSIELAHRTRTQLAVMFLDLDQFKQINDAFGHAVGDQLLQSVARRLIACVRQSDTICRQGGDEFIILLPFIEHSEDAEVAAQKILLSLALPYDVDENILNISASVGISIYPDDGVDAKTLTNNADTAMYCAKENGRNNYKLFKTDMNIQSN
jgi:diguanylate cyclase (GGDEF)-like protein